MQGALGVVQLGKFDEIHKIRKHNKEIIGDIFEKIDGVRTIGELPQSDTSWFGVPLVCKDKDQKAALVKFLEDNRVQTRNYFEGNILMHPAYREIDDFKKYPNANNVIDQVFFVGCSPTITDEMISYIKVVVEKFICQEDK